MHLSLPQASFIQSTIRTQTNARSDGRQFDQFRHISASRGILKGCLGSSLISWAGHTVLVGIKGELRPAVPGISGSIDVPGERDDDDRLIRLTAILDTLLALVDSSELKVATGIAWQLFVEISSCDTTHDGAVAPLSLAVRTALSDLQLPMTNRSVDDAHSAEYTVTDDYNLAHRIKGIQRLPIVFILSMFEGDVLFDASKEESELSSQVAVMIDEDGLIMNVYTLEKTPLRQGLQYASTSVGFDYRSLRQGLLKAQEISRTMFEAIQNVVKDDLRHNVVSLYDIL